MAQGNVSPKNAAGMRKPLERRSVYFGLGIGFIGMDTDAKTSFAGTLFDHDSVVRTSTSLAGRLSHGPQESREQQ